MLTEVLNKASVDKSPDSPEVKAIQNDLKNIQYDVTIGKGYLLKHKTFLRYHVKKMLGCPSIGKHQGLVICSNDCQQSV